VKFVGLNTRIQLEELLRIPAFTIPSIGLPLLTYLIFGLPTVREHPEAAAPVFVAYAAFAVLGIVMFQFGVGIAADRVSPWERYVRTLPAPAGARFAARLIVALAFSVLAVVPLVACAVITSSLSIAAVAWLRVLGALLLGAVPLGLLGLMLGYLLSERGALPVTNLLFLPLSYAGGLFGSTPANLTSIARQISPWLPTRQWSDLLIDFGLGGHLPVKQLTCLVGYGALFAVLAVLGYRSDEARQYR
jgi:ABC-2 type transport system permease protein